MNKHIEILVNTSPLWAEYVSDLLINRIGCSGAVMEEKEFKDEKLIRIDITSVKGYLAYTENFDAQKVREIFSFERKNLILSGINPDSPGSWEVKIREVLEEEWSENWKKFWHPQKVGSKTVICPTWEEYEPEKEDVLIRLDPGSAFGTGTHPTTGLCIQALEKVIPEFSNEITMADVGTGSGILAITAVKLGVSSATGVDNDASVISIAGENAGKNRVQDKCRFFAGSAADITGKYDIVAANILTEVLVNIMPDLKKLLKPASVLILSGIIKRKLPLIEESLEKNSLKTVKILEKENWIALISSGRDDARMLTD